MNHNYKNHLRNAVILLLLLMSGSISSQTQVPVMRIHQNDGAVSEVPIAIVDSITFDYNVGNDMQRIVTDSITSNEVLERAWKMASLQWTPLRPVPRCDGNYYPAGLTVTGIPYSEVKEINTYLFQDVSYHTFMTAVHSPKSVLYTVNISQPPYHGTYSATYYGAVCSSSVMWALGIGIPYYSYNLADLPDFTVNEYQEIDSLKVCDVIWKTGHVQMIYDMEYRADTLYRIKTFETSGNKAHINTYTKAQFVNMWNTCGYIGYRYNKLIHSTAPTVYQQWEPIVYNSFLCPSKGDKAVYRATDTVIIHIYDSTYTNVILSKGSTLVSSIVNHGGYVQFHDLVPGIYNVHLEKEGERTACVSFEVISTDVSYVRTDDDETILVYFESSAFPEYVAIAKQTGYSKYYPISDLDRWRGYITVPLVDYPTYYNLKVVFRGEYGKIINKPIRIE